jgi:hypothetical protein
MMTRTERSILVIIQFRHPTKYSHFFGPLKNEGSGDIVKTCHAHSLARAHQRGENLYA